MTEKGEPEEGAQTAEDEATPSPVLPEPTDAGGSPTTPPVPATPVFSIPVPAPPETVSIEERKAALAQAVAAVIAQGYRVESQSDFQTVLVKGKRPNHILHLILTIITAGAWAIVWIVLALTMHIHRRIVLVNEFGNTTTNPVRS